MKKEISFNEDKTEVTICLSLTKRAMARHPRMTVTTKMVQTMLENDNFKLDRCLLYDTIDNNNENSKHDGRWVFSLFVKKAQKLGLNREATLTKKPELSSTKNKKKAPRKKES
jgi:hypothetical protein